MLKEKIGEDKYNEIKESNDLLYKALEIATITFKNDVDKGGYPYLIHLFSVYANVKTINQKIIALLHDAIEDKKTTKEDLLDVGFPKEIVDSIVALTKEKTEEYKHYINRLCKSNITDALYVKLSDLKNNMDLSRIKNPTEADYERVNAKYKPAYAKINKILEGEK